jgi:alanyl-tRNA synthetase
MEFSTVINERRESLNARLDEVEKDLPAVPKAALRLNRAVSERVLDGSERMGAAATDTATDFAENVSDVYNKTYKSIAKVSPIDMDHFVETATKILEDAYARAEKFAGETVDFATAGVKQVAEQLGFDIDQVETVAKDANAKVAKSVTGAAKKVEASEAKAEKANLSKKTKAELYEMAKDLDVDGRATMSKGELVKAIAKKI